MALVTVKITYGTIKATLVLDSNLFSANTWSRSSGTHNSCPRSGEWEILSRTAAFMNDSSGNPAMVLEAFKKAKVGKKGNGLMQASGFVIPENGVFDWEITKIDEEWWD